MLTRIAELRRTISGGAAVRLRQAEVDNLRRYTLFLLQPHHDVCWLDISVDKVVLVNCGQSGSHLRCNFQRQFYAQPT
jgi:hypothetical protein